MTPIAIAIPALSVSWAVTRWLIPRLRKHKLLDVPNTRSSHNSPTPRGGGIGIVAGIAVALLIAGALALPAPSVVLLGAALLIAGCGAVDDFFGGLSAPVRIAVHFVAAAIVISFLGGLERIPLPPPANLPLGYASTAVAAVWIVGVTNIFNFLDGIDGFAGAQAVLGGIGLVFAGADAAIAITGAAIAGAAAGFLVHNWHPARIFMGDVGSTTLGFLFAVLPWQTAGAERSSMLFYTALLLWFFLADGGFTLLRRLTRGERVWQAHRSHLYQLMASRGTSHDVVVRKIGRLAIPVAFAALIAARSGLGTSGWLALLLAAGLFVVYFRWSDASVTRTSN
jgi:Fuc2NAc and GlcNAc transferase